MRHDKIVAEVLLILSVVHVAVAAPAVVRQGHLDVGGARSEKRIISDNESPSLPQSGAGSMPKTVGPTPLIISNADDDGIESDDEPLRVPQSRLKGSIPFTSWSSDLSPGQPSQSSHPEPVGSDTTAPLTSPAGEPLHLPQPGTMKSDPHTIYSPSSTSPEPEDPLHPEPDPISPAPKGVTWRLPVIHHYHYASPEAPASPEVPASSEAITGSEADKFFNDELKQKMKDYVILGTIAGVSIGLLNGVQKEIMGTISPGAYVSALFPPSPAADI